MAPIKRARSLREAAAARVLKFGVKRARRARQKVRKGYEEYREKYDKTVGSKGRFMLSPKAYLKALPKVVAARSKFERKKETAKRVPNRYLRLAQRIAGKQRNA